MVMFGAVRDVLRKTGLKPHQIGILVVNCSLFNPTPSLAACALRVQAALNWTALLVYISPRPMLMTCNRCHEHPLSRSGREGRAPALR